MADEKTANQIRASQSTLKDKVKAWDRGELKPEEQMAVMLKFLKLQLGI